MDMISMTLSLQTFLIRQMQIEEGSVSCYATAAANTCSRKECCWSHDCFEDALDTRFQQLREIANGRISNY